MFSIYPYKNEIRYTDKNNDLYGITFELHKNNLMYINVLKYYHDDRIGFSGGGESWLHCIKNNKIQLKCNNFISEETVSYINSLIEKVRSKI